VIQTLDFFPQKVGHFRYEGDLSLFIKKIYSLKSTLPNVQNKFLKDLVYKTDMDLLDRYSDFFSLKEYLQTNINSFFNQVYQVKESWAHIYSKYGHSSLHTHGTRSLSGVFYLQTSLENCLFIHNKNNIDEVREITPQNGDIIIFDGNQPHSTTPNLSNQDKIIIAFNLIKV